MEGYGEPAAGTQHSAVRARALIGQARIKDGDRNSVARMGYTVSGFSSGKLLLTASEKRIVYFAIFEQPRRQVRRPGRENSNM